MNLFMFGIVAIIPFLTVFALNFEAIHGYYAYSLPVANSSLDFYQPNYITAVNDYCNYTVMFFSSGKYVFHYPLSECTGAGAFTIQNITSIDGETIEIDFADNDYTITNSKTGLSYKPMPPFSHTEKIRVNQTFVALCNNRPASWPAEGEAHAGTGIVVFQYKGLELHEVTDVHLLLPAGISDVPDGVFSATPGGSKHAKNQTEHPKELLTHKFLGMSGSTHGKIQCDYPQVIEHTIDSWRVDPADIKSFSDVVYEWYK